ncbi:PIN domain protein [bacterium BMS3Bbin09]|nr:PIN domain protein [bacterium BMS3Bbin09]HDO22048.1 type II toxin-antitoxin system VapC family toxin [Nitrospirota bacterium]
MEKISLLVDTDIFIDYFNTGRFSNILENDLFVIYFSAVTEKELLSKKGLKSSEKEAILYTLKNYKRIRINDSIALKYSELRKMYPALDKEDLLIAATALTRKLPVMTRNYKHYKKIKELSLFTGK